MKIEAIVRGQRLVGVDPAGPVEVVAVIPGGLDAITLVYRSSAGVIAERMLLSEDEPSLAEATITRPWSFIAEGEAFQLAAEALRIRFAHLFDPMMAIHTPRQVWTVATVNLAALSRGGCVCMRQ